VVPVSQYFSLPGLRKGPDADNLVVYGPPHLFRAAWLSGARDYLREPWSVDELYLRVRGPGPGFVEWTTESTAYRLEGRNLANEKGGQVRLSAAEAGLLRVLVQRRGSPVSRGVLAWAASCSDGRVVDTLIARIRGKLRRLGGADCLIAVRGVGYRLP